jgi:hypothetical protein
MRALSVLCALALSLGSAAPAAADPILITRGSFTFDSGTFGRLTIAGNRGFSFDGGAEFGAVDFTSSCGGRCDPGSGFSLGAFWVGNDLPGIATIDGRRFDDVGGLNSDTAAQVRFTGTMLVPLVAAPSATSRSRFAFEGSLSVFHPTGAPEVFDFAGGGSVLGTFRLIEGLDEWNLDRLVYHFDGADPTPEPATLLLVATGGIGALVRRRRR